jgi:hypothetical protein
MGLMWQALIAILTTETAHGLRSGSRRSGVDFGRIAGLVLHREEYTGRPGAPLIIKFVAVEKSCEHFC